jgi:hypothetical protein
MDEEEINKIKKQSVKNYYMQRNSFIKYMLGEEEHEISYDTTLVNIYVYTHIHIHMSWS